MAVTPAGTIWDNANEMAYVVKGGRNVECIILDKKGDVRVAAFTENRFKTDFSYVGKSKHSNVESLFKVIKIWQAY